MRLRARSRTREPAGPTEPHRGASGVLGAGELRPSIRPFLVALDLAVAVGAALLVAPGAEPLALVAAALAVTWVHASRDLHRSRLAFSVLEELPVYAFAAVIGALALVASWALLGTAPDLRLAATYAVAVAVGVTLLRVLVYTVIHALRRTGRVAHPTLVVGDDQTAVRIARALRDHPEHGLEPLGLVVGPPASEVGSTSFPVLGRIDELPLVLADLGVQDVVFAHSDNSDDLHGEAVRQCLQADCQVFVVPRFHELMGINHSGRVELVNGIPLLRLKRWPLQPHRILAKRLLDVVVALLMLLCLSPVLLLCAVAVFLEGGRGVLYRQERVGLGGRSFRIYKFRSMRPDTSLEGATTWSIDDDPRVGPVGRFLRRTSLDELPQLFNVLRGDMSLVGPRPERPHFVDEFSREEDRYLDRHRVPSGLTGWAQVNRLRGDTPIDDRVRFDNYYIENWSLWGDIKILLLTLIAVAYRQPPSQRGLPLIGHKHPELPPADQRPELPPAQPTAEVRRVLHVSKPTTEGVANVLMQYVHDQLDRGWQVSVACPTDGWLADSARAAGADVHPWEAERDPGSSIGGEVRRLRRIVEMSDPDVIHLHSAKAGLAGRLATRGRVRTVYQPHGWSFLAADGALGQAARRWERTAGRWTDVLVCVSDAELHEARDITVRGQVMVVPNGVDAGSFPAGTTPAEARTALGLADVPTAVCLGRLVRQKGQDRLLEAWDDVRRRVPDAQLVLVGDGPDRTALEADAPRGVLFVGNQEQPSRWLAAADVVVVPSRWEGMALAPLEALATGRSVVGFDVIGVRESLPTEAAGLVPDGRLDELARAVAARLEDPDLALAEGAEGREHVRRWHDAAHAASLVAEAYSGADAGVDISRVLVGPSAG